MKRILLFTAFIFICANTFAGGLASSTYRWRNNDGNEKTATWKAAAGTGVQISNFDPIRLRIGYSNTGEEAYRFYPKHALTLKDYANDTTIVLSDDPNTTDPFVITSSQYVTDGEPTTMQIYTSNFSPGKVITQQHTDLTQLEPGKVTEIEWCIKPTKYVKPGTQYYFIGLEMNDFPPADLSTSYDIQGTPADTVVSYAARASGNKINIKFTTALNNHDHFVLQQSADNVSFSSVDTIPGGIGTEFKAEVPISSISGGATYEGDRYYRFILYDANKKPTIDRSKKFVFKTYVDLKSFTVSNTGGPIYVDIVTQTEHFQHHGYIYRSYGDKYDRNSYQYIETIFSKGYTDNQPTSYRFWDGTAIVPNGTYVHYVFVWWEGGIEKRSPIRTILIGGNQGFAKTASTELTFNVYPNPATSGKVSFDLKGYTGKTLTATLTSLYGKQLNKQTFNVNATERYTLDAHTSPGTYILNISGDGVTKSNKVLLQ
ncbi:MAG: T9SS type A sorting domain-containing protein [Sphingobacteriaceae bacterium]|nr:MAG: T9SS type A sorting domain-containing protein [Sphingobacteriaceae bacterium]